MHKQAHQTQQLSKATKELPIISKKNNINRWWSVDKKLKSRSTIKFIASIQSNQEQQEKEEAIKIINASQTNGWSHIHN